MIALGKKFSAMAPPMHVWIGAGGVRLAGDSWGDPGAPMVILLHGGGQTRHAWKDTGEHLAASGYYSVAWDARGHGDSEWAADGHYGPDAMMEDLKRIIAAHADTRPTLVGASMGGITSLLAIGEGHVDAAALIMVDVASKIEMEGAIKIRNFMNQKPEGFASLEEAADAISRYQPHRKRPKSLDGLAKNLRRQKDGSYRWHWDPRFLVDVPDIAELNRRFAACARAVTQPILIVRGGLSDILSEEGVREFLEICPHAELVNVSGAGHMIVGDRNDVFGAAAIEFLSRVVPPKSRRS